MTAVGNEVRKEWPPGQGIERRQVSRHQFIERIFISTENGTFIGTSFEISQRGMSVATLGNLQVGQTVSLKPVMRRQIKAIVRRNQGRMFGFEFIDLPSDVENQIKALCETLPLFRTSANI